MKIRKFYLAGAIDKSPDHGIGVRQQIIDFFKDTKYQLINPCDFDYNQSEFPTMWAYQKDGSHDLENCHQYASNIADGDVIEVAESTAIIVILDKYCGPGTSGEVTVARYLNIPVLGVFTKDTNWREVAPWILSRVKRFFFSPEELKKYLLETYEQ